MSKFDFILSVFPHRTTEDITEKYPREPEMRYNSTLTSPVCKEICSTSFPRVSKYGKELHHLLALPAKEKRGYFLHRKHCLIFADHSNCIRGISSDWLIFLCWIRFRDIWLKYFQLQDLRPWTMSADNTTEAADRNVEIWKIKKLIKSLEAARG